MAFLDTSVVVGSPLLRALPSLLDRPVFGNAGFNEWCVCGGASRILPTADRTGYAGFNE